MHPAVFSKEHKNGQGGQMGGNKNVCADTHNTRQCDKSFERREKQYLLSHGGQEIYLGAYQRRI